MGGRRAGTYDLAGFTQLLAYDTADEYEIDND